MEHDPRFRVAVVTLFVERLRRLSADALRAIEADATPFDHYYQLALEMAVAATGRVPSPQREMFEAALEGQFPVIDELTGRALPAGSPVQARVRALMKAASRAILVRDVPGFSSDAFVELWAPFRRIVNLNELERDARRTLLRGTDDTGGVAAAG